MARRRGGNCIVLLDALDGVVCPMKWEVDGVEVEEGKVRVDNGGVLALEILLYSAPVLQSLSGVGVKLSVLLGIL